MELVSLILLAVLAIIVLSFILGSFFTVSTAEVAVLTRFGKFLRVAEAGLNWKAPYLDSVSGVVSLRVNQITLTMETKTKDNVFVTIPISVQNRVRPERVYDAFYKLSDPVAQIKSYVEQVILGHVPGTRRWTKSSPRNRVSRPPSSRNSMPTWRPSATRLSTCWSPISSPTPRLNRR